MKRITIITGFFLFVSILTMSQTSVNIDLRSGVPASGTVWGGCSSTTNIYTNDSDITRAAVHHYGLATGYQYTVIISYSAGLSNYYGCTKNGVTSVDYGSWGGSYSFTGWSYYNPCTTPGAPTNASASPTGTGTANLSWSAGSPSGSATVTYYWEVYTSGGSYVTGSNTSSTSSSVSGLSANTTYYFRVRAFTSCDATYSEWTTSSNFTTLPANPTSISGTNTICNGSNTSLTADGAQGTVYWYTGSCGGTATSPATGNPLTVSPSVTTTYYARNYDNSQFSAGCASITITVNPLLQYRSVQSGNWATLANWQQYNGTGWVAATSFPGQISNDCSGPLVTIQTGHQMEIQSENNINIPNLEIQTTGKLTVKPGGKIFVQDQLQMDESSGGAIIVEANTPPAFTCGTSQVTFTYNGSTVTYGTVVGANNRCWLDRNLGATQVATSSADTDSYGDLFQWGRADDGHQVRVPLSGTTPDLSVTDTPDHANFITINSGVYDWRSDNNNGRWNASPIINNPCPSGYRLPTEAEWNTEQLSWTGNNNSAGAFASPLKLPLAGFRNYSNGSLSSDGTFGFYWGSSVSGTYARCLRFSSVGAFMLSNYRAGGYSVRCIKE